MLRRRKRSITRTDLCGSCAHGDCLRNACGCRFRGGFGIILRWGWSVGRIDVCIGTTLDSTSPLLMEKTRPFRFRDGSWGASVFRLAFGAVFRRGTLVVSFASAFLRWGRRGRTTRGDLGDRVIEMRGIGLRRRRGFLSFTAWKGRTRLLRLHRFATNFPITFLFASFNMLTNWQ